MLSKAAQAVCVASLCLAATTTTPTTTEAFLVPPVALKSAASARGHQHRQQHRSGVSCVRCKTRAPTTTMKGDLDGYNGNNSNTNHYSSKLSALRHRLLPRGSDSRPEEEVAAAGDGNEVSMRARVQRRARAVMHKSFMALATAVIVRSSFSPQAASAVGYRPRTGGAPSSRQLRKKQEQEEKRMDRVRAEVEKEQQQMLDAATSDLNGEISEEQAAAAAAAAEGATGEPATSAAAAAGPSAMVLPTTEELVARICALPTPEEQERALNQCVPDDYRKVWMKLTASQKTAITKLKIKNKSYRAVSIGDHRQMGTRDFAPIAIVFSGFLLYSGMRTSVKIMTKQRKRVKAEAAKFDMERDEFMNVEGEAEFDVDIMKELRDMKEKMAGPGDSYAKDTRAYNPEFAAAAGDEEEYDKKIQEALKGTGKGGKRNKGETRKIFTKDEPTNVDKSVDGGDGGDEAAAAEGGMSEEDKDAAAQAKKTADAKRLDDLFNSSSIDDPEDDLDLGDDGEPLP